MLLIEIAHRLLHFILVHLLILHKLRVILASNCSPVVVWVGEAFGARRVRTVLLI